jgi:hypothetical protein
MQSNVKGKPVFANALFLSALAMKPVFANTLFSVFFGICNGIMLDNVIFHSTYECFITG